MRDRLIELIESARHWGSNTSEEIADRLLANGVIVPPVKVGDIVYSINRKPLGGHWDDNRYIVDGWSEYQVCEQPFSLTLWECGWKGIFLTREEAEQALAKMKGGERDGRQDI